MFCGINMKVLAWHWLVQFASGVDNSYWNSRPAGQWNSKWSPLQQWQKTVPNTDLLAMWYMSHWTTTHLLPSSPLCHLLTECLWPRLISYKISCPSVIFSSLSFSSRAMHIFILLFLACVLSFVLFYWTWNKFLLHYYLIQLHTMLLYFTIHCITT